MQKAFSFCRPETIGIGYLSVEVSARELQAILDLPETTEEEKQSRQKAELKMLLTVQNPLSLSPAAESWPYFVGAATTYGQYHYDFSFLREALKAEALAALKEWIGTESRP